MTSKTRSQKAAARAARNKSSLATFGDGGKHLAAAPLKMPVGERGLLRLMFKLARSSDLAGKERMDLLQGIERRIFEAFKGIGQSGGTLRLKDFGVKNARELAEMFVKELEDMNISPKTLRAFISHRQIEGYRNRVRGKLFHLYVRNFAPLQEDLLKWAVDQVEELNNPKLSGTFTRPNVKVPALVNALGDRVTEPIKFEDLPFKVEKIHIIKADGKRVEFIDDAYVSFSGTGNERFVTFLTETEVKTAGAAKGLSEQIASAQLRTGSADTSLIELVGYRSVRKNGRIVFEDKISPPIPVEPKRIVYSPRSINRSGVTLLSAGKWARIKETGVVDAAKIYASSEFRLSSTAKGMGETYLFIRLAVSTDELNKIVHAVWPGSPRR
jgi:hypothetical protein